MRDVNNTEVVEVSDLKALPGYPFLPCPICNGIEGCDHSVPERARTTHPGLSAAPFPNPKTEAERLENLRSAIFDEH